MAEGDDFAARVDHAAAHEAGCRGEGDPDAERDPARDHESSPGARRARGALGVHAARRHRHQVRVRLGMDRR
jgi:hypothetical protein